MQCTTTGSFLQNHHQNCVSLPKPMIGACTTSYLSVSVSFTCVNTLKMFSSSLTPLGFCKTVSETLWSSLFGCMSVPSLVYTFGRYFLLFFVIWEPGGCSLCSSPPNHDPWVSRNGGKICPPIRAQQLSRTMLVTRFFSGHCQTCVIWF